MPLLNWLNKDEAVQAGDKVPYRLLEAVPELTYGDVNTENMLIQGDNLEGLKALLPYYAGKVKCIFIDPPYNTKSAFEHYDDNLEHSKWLSMMYPRLELLQELLAENGSIWVTIDDNEAHYLKVMMDEVFGRENFVVNFVWQKKFSPQNDAKYVSMMHDHVICFAKSKRVFKINKISPFTIKTKVQNLDGDSRGSWKSVDYTCNKNKRERPNLYYPISQPNTGEEIYPKETAVWRYSFETHQKHVDDGLIYWGKTGENKVPRYKKFKTDGDDLQVPSSILFHQDVGNTQDARKESIKLDPNVPFSTPKPEMLLRHIINMATLEGDWVLDSYLGSATTSAVAHKMDRRYIGIEMGEHAVTHCAPRLQKVVDGEQGGISKAVNWQGGGGFRFYRLGQAVFDEQGQICSDIDFTTLAAHIWYLESKTPLLTKPDSPLIGIHNDVAYYLLYNGILGDKRPHGGNVLTSKVLANLPAFDGPKVIYGETTRMGSSRLDEHHIIFKQTPYDIKVR